MEAVSNLENIGDIVETNLVVLGQAQVVTGMKDEINRIAESAASHEARRLIASEPNRILAYTLEVEIIEKQKRIYYFAKRMAKSVLPAVLQQRG